MRFFHFNDQLKQRSGLDIKRSRCMGTQCFQRHKKWAPNGLKNFIAIREGLRETPSAHLISELIDEPHEPGSRNVHGSNLRGDIAHLQQYHHCQSVGLVVLIKDVYQLGGGWRSTVNSRWRGRFSHVVIGHCRGPYRVLKHFGRKGLQNVRVLGHVGT